MMIFSLTLTANQIRTLRAIEACNDRGDHREMVEMSHFVTGARGLIREGLVTHRGRPDPGYDITEKGRLVLKLVEQDVKDFLKQIEEPEATARPAGKAKVAS